jgi:hypothetical protein
MRAVIYARSSSENQRDASIGTVAVPAAPARLSKGPATVWRRRASAPYH